MSSGICFKLPLGGAMFTPRVRRCWSLGQNPTGIPLHCHISYSSTRVCGKTSTGARATMGESRFVVFPDICYWEITRDRDMERRYVGLVFHSWDLLKSKIVWRRMPCSNTWPSIPELGPGATAAQQESMSFIMIKYGGRIHHVST
jgi:hypothetical protein